MEKQPIDELLSSKDILLYLVGRRLLNLGINASKEDVDLIKELSNDKELDEIVMIMLKKYRNYSDRDYQKCQLCKTL